MSKVQVDKVVNLSDDGAPQLTYGAELPVGYGLTGAGGLNISGVVTAASAVFSGNVTIGGTLTYEDVTNIDAVGVITAQSGVNISGGEFKVGTAVTVGSVGVSTFTKNVNIEGNVAIGLKGATASSLTPVLQLHKKASSATSYLHITNTDSGVTNSDGFLIGFNGSNDALIFNKESTPLRFATAGAEQMRIAADGKVGIDSTAPNYQLDVGNSVGSATTVFINATNQAQSLASRAELRLGYSHSGGKAVGYVRLDEAATNSFDGNVTIGVPYNNGSGGSSTQVPIKFKGSTTSDNGNIEIYGTAAGISSVTWDGSANTLIFKDGSYAAFGDSSDLKIFHASGNSYIEDAGTGGLVLLSNGTLIETKFGAEHAIKCTKDAQVDLYHDNSIKLTTTSTGSQTTGEAIADSFGQRLRNSNTGSTNDNYWKIGSYTGNGSEGFIATWIGTAGYSSGQQISGAMTLHARVSNGSTLEGIYTGETSGGALAVKDIRWKHEGSSVYSIWVKVGNYGQISPFVQTFGGTWTTDNTNTTSSTAPASSTGFTQSAYKQVGNNLTIQYAETATTFNQNINMASGKGIDFSATGDSNGTTASELFHDYEEGTWTPTLAQGYTSITYNTQSGTYTKIGNRVTWTCFLYISGASGAAATVNIGGFPFPTTNTANQNGGGYASYFNGTMSVDSGFSDKDNATWYMSTNTSAIAAYKQHNGVGIYGNDTSLGTGGNNMYFVLAGTYKTDA